MRPIAALRHLPSSPIWHAARNRSGPVSPCSKSLRKIPSSRRQRLALRIESGILGRSPPFTVWLAPFQIKTLFERVVTQQHVSLFDRSWRLAAHRWPNAVHEFSAALTCRRPTHSLWMFGRPNHKNDYREQSCCAKGRERRVNRIKHRLIKHRLSPAFANSEKPISVIRRSERRLLRSHHVGLRAMRVRLCPFICIAWRRRRAVLATWRSLKRVRQIKLERAVIHELLANLRPHSRRQRTLNAKSRRFGYRADWCRSKPWFAVTAAPARGCSRIGSE